jgi:hypothetical protein
VIQKSTALVASRDHVLAGAARGLSHSAIAGEEDERTDDGGTGMAAIRN